MSDERDETPSFSQGAMSRRNSTGQHSSSEFNQSKDHTPAQSANPGNQCEFSRPAAQSSGTLPDSNRSNDPCHSAINTAPKMPSSTNPASSTADIPWQDGIQLVMPKPDSHGSSHLDDPSTMFIRSQGTRKWISTEDYLDFIRQTQPVLASLSEPQLSDVEDVLSDSELKSQQCNNGHLSESSAPRPGVTTENDRIKEGFASALQDLYTIQSELNDLLSRKQFMMRDRMERLLKIISDRTRKAVLNEVSKALRDRAATKFTMGRSERLILEREADVISRMTSTRTSRVAEKQHVESLLDEHNDIWRALEDNVHKFFYKASTAAEKAYSRLP